LDLACVGCGTASPNFGTITATDDGSNLRIDVELANNVTFNPNGNTQHNALVFDLVGTPTISVFGSLPSGFSLISNSAGSISEPPFGAFEYGITYNPAKFAAPVSSLVFELANLSVSALASQTFQCTAPDGCTTSGTYNVVFASDVANSQSGFTVTGNVGDVAPVPEPSTWAMMI
jgi:hypothetical protein